MQAQERAVVLYLYILREGQPPTQGTAKSILDAYTLNETMGDRTEVFVDRSGRPIARVEVLGGSASTGPLPTHPDEYVIAICLLALKQRNISFDTAKDQIAYSVDFDPVTTENIGVCQIRVRDVISKNAPDKTSALAKWSLGLAIVSLWGGFITGIPGLILGIVELRRIKRFESSRKGRRYALAGAIISGIFIAFSVFIWFYLWLSGALSGEV